MEHGLPGRALGQQGFVEHAGIAGRILRSHPAFIAQEHINLVPGQGFLPQQAVGRCRGGAAGKGQQDPIALGQGQPELVGQHCGCPLGELIQVRAYFELVDAAGGSHGSPAQSSHSVWKLPAWSTRS